MRQEPGSDLFLTQRPLSDPARRSPQPKRLAGVAFLRIAQRWMQRYYARGTAGQAHTGRSDRRPQPTTSLVITMNSE
jgi:hypothetical protein